MLQKNRYDFSLLYLGDLYRLTNVSLFYQIWSRFGAFWAVKGNNFSTKKSHSSIDKKYLWKDYFQLNHMNGHYLTVTQYKKKTSFVGEFVTKIDLIGYL